MEVLYYNELDVKGVKKQLKKVEAFLKKGDFKSAEVKKITHTSYFRAKLDYASRLLFTFAKHKETSYILLLEIIHNHEYEKSRFLRGATVNEKQWKNIAELAQVETATVHPLVYINPTQSHFHILDKVISLDKEQQEIFGLPAPLIVIGSAGSGKTALTLEKMKHLRGNIAYISLSSYLVENAQNTYYSHHYDNPKQEIDFLSFKEYIESIQLPKGREIRFKDFERWYNRYRQVTKIKEDYKLFEEFKGVLTGSIIDKSYLSRADYINLGIKQSIFLAKERPKVYDIFEKYLKFLEEGNFYDSNMVAYHHLSLVTPKYDFVLIDEVQDLTNVQLMLILRSLKNSAHFILSGDSNQIVHPNFFSWSQLKSMFFKSDLKGSLLRILKTNYRNSIQITRLSNDLLKIKNARFGSIDKESTYLINTVSTTEGAVNFLVDKEKIRQELNEKTENSTKFAVLVMTNEDKAKVRRHFKTPLIFSIQEAKGLEYENIILVNFMSNYRKEFREICRDVSPEDILDENMRYSRAKNKANKELEAYKFYINSLYVAFTRAVKNLYVLEKSKKHDLLHLLAIKTFTEQLTLDAQASNDEEWLEEARRLELQGKFEQAQQIRDRIKGVQYLTEEELERLIERALDPKLKDKQAQKLVFEHAKARFNLSLIQALGELRYSAAQSYLKHYKKDQQNYFTACRLDRASTVQQLTKKYSVDFETTGQLTGLMLGAEHSANQVLGHLLANNASKTKKSEEGLTALQIAMRTYDREDMKLQQLTQIYPKLQPTTLRVKTSERMIKVSPKLMEYFLLNYIIAIRDDLIMPDDPPEMQGLNMDDFMIFIEEMPDVILAPYRRKRQYVNSVLAKNEINRAGPYNRKLFVRVARGRYNLNPDMEVF